MRNFVDYGKALDLNLAETKIFLTPPFFKKSQVDKKRF